MVEILGFVFIALIFTTLIAAFLFFQFVIKFQYRLISELIDRVMSESLPEFRKFNPVIPPATPKSPPDKSKAKKEWVGDPFAEESTKIPDPVLGGVY